MVDGANVVEWVLTSPEARTLLIDWRESWALPSMAALRVHSERWPDDERLHDVIEKVRIDPTARKMWNDRDLPTVTYPVSSSPRRLHLPHYGGKEFSVRILVLEPLELPTCRLVALTPAELVPSERGQLDAPFQPSVVAVPRIRGDHAERITTLAATTGKPGAGTTPRPRQLYWPGWGHPRRRGDYAASAQPRASAMGTPPAGAGTTAVTRRAGRPRREHPRRRGDHEAEGGGNTPVCAGTTDQPPE